MGDFGQTCWTELFAAVVITTIIKTQNEGNVIWNREDTLGFLLNSHLLHLLHVGR